MQLMLEIKWHIEQKLNPERRNKLNYTEIGYVALGPFGKWAVNIAVLGCNLGVCAGYMIFISINLQVCVIYSVLPFLPFHQQFPTLYVVGVQLYLDPCARQCLLQYVGGLRHPLARPHPPHLPAVLSIPRLCCLCRLRLPRGRDDSKSRRTSGD